MKANLFIVFTACGLIQGCGGGGGDESENKNGPGSASSLSSASIGLDVEPCIATFTEDYLVTDVFGEEFFTAKTGESFILSRLGYTRFGQDNVSTADLYYLVNEGAYGFQVEIEDDNTSAFPFVSNCEVGETERFVGVFHDTTLYSDEELTQEVCSLTKSVSAGMSSTTSTGYS
ncbi:MAG: hypothetical protein JKY67_15870 [Pseudomonadales bacterium]|nr:hypothetical protein [Pseudomonadales bacterium]